MSEKRLLLTINRHRLLLIAFIALIALVIVGVTSASATKISDGDDASGPLDISGAKVAQSQRSLVFTLHSRGDWRPASLDRFPEANDPTARYACLLMHRLNENRTTRLCFGEPGAGKRSKLGLSVLRDGQVVKKELITARVDKLNQGHFQATFSPARANLDTGRYRWRSATQWSGPECLAVTALSCQDRAPNDGEASFRLLPVQPVSCRRSGPTPVLNGPRNHKLVALTFDDGPSDYTSRIMSILRDKNAKGTFFLVGDQLVGREKTGSKLLKEGHELANHSLRHEYKPSRSSMRATNRHIKDATGFRPCVFRPPYGAYDSRVVGDAKDLGMTTANWDVDPQDWTTPGSDAIYQRVVSQTRPGSIVLMHDGGGDRSQTVDALPRIINNLKDRGFRLVTVSKLLGQKTIWKPVKPSSTRQSSVMSSPLPENPDQFKPPSEFEISDTHGLGLE